LHHNTEKHIIPVHTETSLGARTHKL